MVFKETNPLKDKKKVDQKLRNKLIQKVLSNIIKEALSLDFLRFAPCFKQLDLEQYQLKFKMKDLI